MITVHHLLYHRTPHYQRMTCPMPLLPQSSSHTLKYRPMDNTFWCHLLPSPVQPLKVCSTFMFMFMFYVLFSDSSVQRALRIWPHNCLPMGGIRCCPSVGPEEDKCCHTIHKDRPRIIRGMAIRGRRLERTSPVFVRPAQFVSHLLEKKKTTRSRSSSKISVCEYGV